MNAKIKNTKILLIVLAMTLLTADFAAAQDAKPTRLRNGVNVKSFIGGEAHDYFTIRARRGQTITVQITRRLKRGGNFNLTVTKGASLSSSTDVNGTERSGRTWVSWTGRAPTTTNYYFDLTAYPPHKYTIRVTVR
jgi:hypothetical protein